MAFKNPWRSISRLWKQAHMNQIIILITALSVLGVLLYFAWLASNANIDSLRQGLAQSTIIYDKDAMEASKVSANRVEGVEITKVPEYLQNAIIAIEDHRFKEHNGFDLKGIARAFFINLKAGQIKAGGSTITQQLTKVALLSHERTYRRKLEEVFLAVEIEKTYTKDEILEMYMNQVYFGSGAWGVQNASRKYFGKDVEDINLSEAAMLAGIINRPSAINPYKNFEASVERRNLVLQQMEKFGMISSEERLAAESTPIVLSDKGGDPLKGKYPYYVDAVLNEAINKYGLTQDDLLTKGYKIYTQLDQNLQASLEKVYENDSLFPVASDGTLAQSGGILIDPQTGGIRALVGGRGEHTFRGYNRATQLKAQPGSILKPIAVYTPALERGYDPYSLLKDDETLSFDGYQPRNANGIYSGEVPLYKAIEESLNVPAVWLLNEIGINSGVEMLQRFGLPVQKDDQYLSLALGGTKTGYSPLQMAEAYSVYANRGEKVESHIITKIIGPTGNVIVDVQPERKTVIEPEIADQITSMLLNVVETGTGKRLRINDYAIAGKTGSTQFNSSTKGTKDQWFVGYTPNLVGAVWLGYDYTDEDHHLIGSSGDLIVPIFQAIMEQSLQFVPKEEFPVKSINVYLEQKRKEEEERNRKDNRKNFDEFISDEAEKWKEKLEEGKTKWKQFEEQLKEKLKNLW